MNYKRAISPVIAMILLVSVTVIIGVGVYQFLSEYSQNQLLQSQDNLIFDDLNIRIIDVDSERVLFQTNRDNFTIFRTLLDGVECSSEEETLSGRPLRVNISSCSSQISTSRPRLIVETDRGIIQRDLNARDLGVVVGGSQEVSTTTPTLSGLSHPCVLSDNKSDCLEYYIETEQDGIAVIHDTNLGLYWQREPDLVTFNNITQANEHCSLIGDNWKLPTKAEMQLSLVDIGGFDIPHIIGGNGNFFTFDVLPLISGEFLVYSSRSCLGGFSCPMRVTFNDYYYDYGLF